MSERSEKGRGWIIAIATFRVVKAVIVIAGSAGVFALLSPALADRLMDWLDVEHGHTIIDKVLGKIPFLDDRMLLGIGLGGLVYATLFLVEAYGLFRGRVWAEWLTVVATTSFIPFEIYELVKDVTPLRVAALVANIAIVIYLLVRRLRDRAEAPQRYTRSRGAALAQST